MSTPSRGPRVFRWEGTTRRRPMPGRSRSARLGPIEWISFPLSWALIAFGITLVFLSARAVLAVGGSCAEGGPYVIAVPCPGQTTLLTSAGILAYVAGTFVSLFGQRGFGVPAWGYGWAGLFGLGAAAFFEAGFREDVWTWHLCGWIFVALALGAVPMLFIWWPQSVLGCRALDGTEPAEGRYGVIDGAVVWAVCIAAIIGGVLAAGSLVDAGT
jgi:hypothetical protein